MSRRGGRRAWLAHTSGGLAAALFAGVAGAPLGRRAHAHPHHTTQTEARLDPESWMVQLSLRVLPEDLEEALRRHSGLEGPLESAPPRAILAYLRHQLQLRHDAGTRMPPRWHGMELSTREAWIHVDYRLPSEARSLTIDHRLFFELEDDQLNTLRWRAGTQRKTVILSREQPTVTLDLVDSRPPRGAA